MIWVFGYGSLVWRPGIPWDARVEVRLRGWKRRFWQGSTDHRGVPGAPGRVATMVPSAVGETVGVAWRVPTAEVEAVLAQLDHREKGGYERLTLEVEPLHGSGPRLRVLSWVATPENPEWLGPAPLRAMAAQIAGSTGPSGPNAVYVARLQAALEEMGVRDGHVAALARAVRRVRGEGSEAG